MKIEEELVIRQVAGEIVLIPTGKAALKNPGLITLNASGELLVKKLCEGCEFEDLVECILEEYEVEREQAEHDVVIFLDKLRERGLL